MNQSLQKNSPAVAPPVAPAPATQTVKTTDTFWHAVVFFNGTFADYQIAMSYPFFHMGEVRAAIEKEVKSPVIIMNWAKLGIEEWLAAKQFTPRAEPNPETKVAAVPSPAKKAKAKKK